MALEDDLKFLGAELVHRGKQLVVVEYQGYPISFNYHHTKVTSGYGTVVVAFDPLKWIRRKQLATFSFCLEADATVEEYLTSAVRKISCSYLPSIIRRRKRLFLLWRYRERT